MIYAMLQANYKILLKKAPVSEDSRKKFLFLCEENKKKISIK